MKSYQHLIKLGFAFLFVLEVCVENKEKLVSNDIKNKHAKIVERQKMTYAEAVKMQNKECMEEMKQHLTLASSR